MRRSARLNKNLADQQSEQEETPTPPPPPPKKAKPKRIPLRDRPRPEYAYNLVNNVPVSAQLPDYEELENPLSFEQSKSLGYSLHVSRNNWLSGQMFETFWTRKPRGKKYEQGEQNMRDRMLKLCECIFIMGPHVLPAKLFTVREETEEPITASEQSHYQQQQGPDPQQANQMVVYRLQQMAKSDPALKSLMAEVASGKAKPQTVAEFQKYITKAKELDPPITHFRPPAPSYAPQTRRVLKHVALAFEFVDNQMERFLLPRKSILQQLPNEDILISFLHLSPPIGESNKVEYTPTTITMRGISSRAFPSIERCFEPKEKVQAWMAETMAKGIRSEEHYVWYQIEKSDVLLNEDIRKFQPPYFAVPPPKRPYKPRTLPKPTSSASAAPPASSSTPALTSTSASTPTAGSSTGAEAAPIKKEAEVRAKLNLPDPETLHIPPGGLPPLPKSMRGMVPNTESTHTNGS